VNSDQAPPVPSTRLPDFGTFFNPPLVLFSD
jgi:hypothetical protein